MIHHAVYRAGRNILVYLVILIHVLSSGCTVPRHVPAGNPADLARALEPGDKVTIQTRQGEKFPLTIVTVDPEKITGEGREVRLSDIEQVQREEVSTGHTVGAVMLFLTIVGVILGEKLKNAAND